MRKNISTIAIILLIGIIITFAITGQRYMTFPQQKLDYITISKSLDTSSAGRVATWDIGDVSTQTYLHYVNTSDTTTDSVIVSNVEYWGNIKRDSVVIAGTPTNSATLQAILIIPASSTRKFLLNDKFIDNLYVKRINVDSGSIDQSDVDSAFVSGGSEGRND